MIDRQKVLDKYNGHCAYCGCEITQKTMQVDHIKNQHGFWIGKKGYQVHKGIKDDTDINGIDNLNPACAVCNKWKSTFSIEDFRYEISEQINRAEKTSANFRMAKRYGLIQVLDKPIKFYFEP